MPLRKLHGRKLMLINMIYQPPLATTDWHDSLSIVYRDLVTDETELLVLNDPEYTIYSVKPEYRTFRKPRHMMPMEQLDPHTIKYKDRFKEIAKIAGPEYVAYLKDRSNDKRRLMKYPYVLGADVDIETFYRVKWKNELDNDEAKPISVVYLDIEVDSIDIEGFPKSGECPVNAVTVIDSNDKRSYTFLLDNGKNEQIKTFIDNQKAFQEKLHNTFDNAYGYIDYNIYMFTDEIKLLQSLLTLIHSIKPMFDDIWNMSFDIPYLLDRCTVLGFDPAEIFCHSDFPYPTCNYYKDTKSKNFRDKKDFFNCASYTHHRCQQITYQGLRKSQGVIKRTNLDSIGKKELGEGKLEFRDSASIKTLPYVDYEKFVLYNIKDVLLQYGIDNKCNDTMNVYLSSLSSYVPYKDILKQTVALSGLLQYELTTNYNMVLGNNTNYDNSSSQDDDDDEDGYEGAINGDPMNNDRVGVELFGVPSRFYYKDVIDLDFSSMYPSIMDAYNEYSTTMIGKVILDAPDIINYDEDLGKELVEDIILDDVAYLGTKYLNLPSTEDILKQFIPY